jgi:hypothetical protein
MRRTDGAPVSGSGLRESHAHDVMITKEAHNYRMDGLR